MIHQSLTKDLRCTLWLYQLLFSHLLEGLLDILCKTCWCDLKAHTLIQIHVQMFPFSYSFLMLTSVGPRGNAGECRLLRLSPEVSLFGRIVVEQKNSLRSEEKREIFFLRKKRGGSLMTADWKHLEAVFRGRRPEWATLAFKYSPLLETKNLPASKLTGAGIW